MTEGKLVAIIAGLLIVATLGGCFGYPLYNVYSQKQAGVAELARAESNRQIRVREAQASLDSADLTAQAEVRRATGVAEANAIIAESLGGPEGYLRWRYIEMLENSGGNSLIYIPTEGAMPILEAGRANNLAPSGGIAPQN